MEPATAPGKRDGEREDVSSGSDTSRWSTPTTVHCTLHGWDTFEDKTVDELPSLTFPTPTGPITSKKVKQGSRQKKNHDALKLPPVKPLQISWAQPLDTKCVKNLKSQMWELQQQLAETQTENKLLKKDLHFHTVALQFCQDSEDSIFEIISKHHNETRTLRKLLHDTRVCRDSLAKQLQSTESKLVNMGDALHRLQVLSQNRNLLEREELTTRLAKATEELVFKDRKLQEVERNLELCKTSFKRQLMNEQGKIKAARNASFNLQMQVTQMNREIQNRERELEKYYIYSQRFQKEPAKKDFKSKMVQTENISPVPEKEASPERRFSVSYTRPKPQKSAVTLFHNSHKEDSLVIENLDKGVSPSDSLEEETPEQSTEEDSEGALTEGDEGQGGLFEEGSRPASLGAKSLDSLLDDILASSTDHEELLSEPMTDPPVNLEEKEDEIGSPQIKHSSRRCNSENDIESHTPGADTEATSPTSSEPKRMCKLHRIRHKYVFTETVENLHCGRPAFSNLKPNQSDEFRCDGDGEIGPFCQTEEASGDVGVSPQDKLITHEELR